ncbi:acyltransferase family protein [Pseudomonas sp. YL-218 TE3947]|jgi:peptidoglycan/LPS O-acetylase OafA/YrhL|uniref:acyltransferase family protein n=1 Tax=Pseudomonas TaxID=286 RepID=UPI003D1A6C20
MEKRTLDWLQGLRGIAALLIVFVHARYVLRGTPSENFSESLLMPGAMGVDLFFLISGFIMVYTTRDSDSSLKYSAEFIARRVARILPTYATVSILGVYLLRPDGYLLELSNFKAILKSLLFLPINRDTPPFFDMPWGLGWTLNFEMYFYLFFAVSMLAGAYRRHALLAWTIATLILLPMLTKGSFSLDPQNNYGFKSTYLNLMTNPVIWLFPAGMLIGTAYLSSIRLPKGVATNCLVIAAISIAIWSGYSGLFKFHGISHWGGPIAIAFLIFSISDLDKKIKTPKSLLWLGKVSFSLYLTHPIAQGLISKIIRSLDREDMIHTWSYIFITTIAALILAHASYLLLEVKLTNIAKEKILLSLDNTFNKERPTRTKSE